MSRSRVLPLILVGVVVGCGDVIAPEPMIEPEVSYARVPFGGASYVSLDLGTLGGLNSLAYAVNNRGMITGDSDTGDGDQRLAFLWTCGGGMIPLGTLGGVSSYGRGVNIRGQVVGRSQDPHGNWIPFLWSAQTGMNALPLLPGHTQGVAWDINNRGQITGYTWALSPEGVVVDSRTVLWNQGTVIDVSGGSEYGSRGYAINRKGAIAGVTDGMAVMWKPGMVMLGVEGPARGINGRDQVVGSGLAPSGQSEAFVWDSGNVSFLGTLVGGSRSYADDINLWGQVVGWSHVAPDYRHAVSWENGAITDLMPVAGSYSRAYQVNEWRWIVGGYDADGLGGGIGVHAYLWVPSRLGRLFRFCR